MSLKAGLIRSFEASRERESDQQTERTADPVRNGGDGARGSASLTLRSYPGQTRRAGQASKE